MSALIIIHHMGIGDAIMLNGMVRHFAGSYDKVAVVCKDCHEEILKFMYRDISKKVDIILVPTTSPQVVWNEVNNKAMAYAMAGLKTEIKPLATYCLTDDEWAARTQKEGQSNWSKLVYDQAGLSHSVMRDKFKVVRDPSRELVLEEKEYIFVHDDPERDRVIPIEKDIHVFKPHSKVTNRSEEFFECNVKNIFDYTGIIENAKEIHCMNSSYNWMVELMKLGKKETNFFHLNVAHKYYTPPDQCLGKYCAISIELAAA